MIVLSDLSMTVSGPSTTFGESPCLYILNGTSNACGTTATIYPADVERVVCTPDTAGNPEADADNVGAPGFAEMWK